ncbi:MAG: DUF4330 domain-containing protein [Defluviitaleaceae bacterium]|nr:DUF4330 domain-containing protein [Defluviitaleaceae bacterium]
MIDNSGRIKGRVSIIDIILVAAVLVLAAGFMYTQVTPRIQEVVNPTERFHLVIQSDGIRHFMVDAVSVGDVMFRLHDRQPLGTVIDIEVLPSMEPLLRSDGTAILAEREGRYRINITIDAVGSIRENVGYFINGTDHMAPGREVQLVSNMVFLPNGRVQSVTHLGS